MRRFLHALLVLLAVVPWLAGCLLFGCALLLTMAAHKLEPQARWGNCWSFVAPRWIRRGGYIAVRLSGRPRIFGRRFIPHAMWLASILPGTELEQTEPDHRITRLRDVWQVLYFRFHIRKEA